jgi:hypothetical protein
MLAASLKPPTCEEVRKLSMLDIAVMNGLADFLRNILKKYIQIDPYTMPDPFGSEDEYNYSVILDRQQPRRVVAMIKDEYNYSVILDRQQPRRVVAMIASKLESLPQLPWDDILGDRFIRLSLSKTDANAIKNELMPKDTNNFYQFRRSGKVNGYIMFAFQICGQR